MKKLGRIALFSLVVFGAASLVAAAPKKDTAAEPPLSKAVRESLEGLRYYGVFDVLNYKLLDNGVVELGGYVFRDSLREEAEETVVRVPGVKQVVNKIEELGWGVSDDEIRAKVYLNIYRDAFLSRYGTASDQALANGIGFGSRGRFGVFGSMGIGNPYFPGFNPAGAYAIRILVTNGEVILMGEVDNEGDKHLAAMKARSAFPVKKVYNELSVRGEKPEPGTEPAPKAKPGKRGVVLSTDAS